MAHTEIVVSGSPVNPDLAMLFDFDLAFAQFGMTERYEVTADTVTRAADGGGTIRAGALASLVSTGAARTQSDVTHQPAFVAGGGPGGLSDALLFSRARADRLGWSPLGPTGKQTRVELIKPSNHSANGQIGQLFSGQVGAASQSSFYVVQGNPGSIGLQAYIGVQATGKVASVGGLSIPENAWAVVMMTWDPATLQLAIGTMAAGGGGAVSWAVATAPADTVIPAAALSFGASSDLVSRGFSGLSAGSLLFTGHDARTESEMLAAIRAWAFGGDSRFGL